MAATYLGNDGSSLVLLPDYPTLERKEDGTWQVVYKYWCAQSSAESLIPAAGAACPLTGHTDLTLRSAKVTPYNNVPNRVYLELVYTDPSSGGGAVQPSLGTVIQESETAFFEETIEGAPGDPTSADKNAANANNARVVKRASVTYSRTTHHFSFTWSEKNIISDDQTGTHVVGSLMNPTGMISPTAKKWLFTGKSIRTINSNLIEVRESWTYDGNGWNDIRPNAYSG